MQTVNRRSICQTCWHGKDRRPRICRYGCLCFDPITVANRNSSKAIHYILQQLPTSHISHGKAGSETEGYLLKALRGTSSLCNSILKGAFGLGRSAVGCPYSFHSFRFQMNCPWSAPSSSSAPTLLLALLPCLKLMIVGVGSPCTVSAIWSFCTLQHLLPPGTDLALWQCARSISRKLFIMIAMIAIAA